MQGPLKKTLLSFMIAAPLVTFAANALTPEQSQAVDKRIKQYLMDHPESVIQSIKNFQHKMEAERSKKAQESLTQNQAELNKSDELSTLGNPNGSISIIEFMDYRCGHCKSMGPVLEQAIASNNDIKVVVKALTYFGKSSQTAAKAALAAGKQGKFAEVHKALLKAPPAKLSNEAGIFEIIEGTSADIIKLKKDMASAELDQKLQSNQALAQKLYINATPMFVLRVGDRQAMIPGAVPLAKIKQTIAAMGQKNSKNKQLQAAKTAPQKPASEKLASEQPAPKQA